jgi:transposase
MPPVESGQPASPACPRCAELAALLSAALGRVAELEQRVRELEARLGQDSSNSSKPPSSDPPSAPARAPKAPTGRKPGGQPGHPGHARTRLPVERVKHFVNHVPGSCGRCHAPLPFEPRPHDPEPTWHQVAELPPVAAEVTEHRGHYRTCPCCGEVTHEPVPAGVRSHGFGPRLAALMSYLSGRCHDGRRLVEEFVEDVLGVPLSLGTVSAYEAEAAAALAPAHAQAAAAVAAAPNRNVDETGWGRDRQGVEPGGRGKARWLWVAASRAAAVFSVQPGRGREGLESVLGADPGGGPGVVTSDRLAAYAGLPLELRQVCWAHLRRDFTKWSQPGGHTAHAMAVGAVGRDAAGEVLGLWRDFRQGEVGRAAMEEGMARLRRRVQETLRRGAALTDPRDAGAAAFCRNLLAIEPALWTFARPDVAEVEPTNNHAERCLRPAVLWRKNSFGSHSDAGCHFVERLLTAVTTLRLQGRSVLEFLHRAILAHRTGAPAPSLLA